jgi:hypothetical protein
MKSSGDDVISHVFLIFGGKLASPSLDCRTNRIVQSRKEFCEWRSVNDFEGDCCFKWWDSVLLLISRELCPIAVSQKKRNLALRQS